MCNLSEGIAERAFAEGYAKGFAEVLAEGQNEMLFMLLSSNALNRDVAYTQSSLSKEDFDNAYEEWLKNNKSNQ